MYITMTGYAEARLISESLLAFFWWRYLSSTQENLRVHPMKSPQRGIASKSKSAVSDSEIESDQEELTLYCFKTKSLVKVPEYLRYGSCSRVTDFEKLNRIGEGTYGIVYRARHKLTGEIVALKKVRTEKETEGISVVAMREISLLLDVRHENIVQLKEVAVGHKLSSMYLVMEYCEQDMASLVDNMPKPFSEAQIKCILIQLLKALEYLHRRYIIHRDVKLSNMLMTSDGSVKLGDFGLTRRFSDITTKMTPDVVTLWYRAPEILLGARLYSTAIDIWAAGCIFGELLQQKPLLPGRSELHQIDLIVELLGTPTEQLWPELLTLPMLKKFNLRQQPYNNLKHRFSQLSECGISLLNLLLLYDPKRRGTAADALKSSYFVRQPMPCPKDMMPSFVEYRNL